MKPPAPPRKIVLQPARQEEAAEIATLVTVTNEGLTRKFGKGHWSFRSSEKGVLAGMRRSSIYVARHRATVVATLALTTRRPWAIDRSYFTKVTRPLYLTGMAIHPELQAGGIGRMCMAEALRIAREWPADAIRLDAYDANAGAGGFYAKCGYREVGRATYRKTPLVYYELVL